MREYEVMWVVAPTETDEAVEAMVKQYEELLRSAGTEIVKSELWGRRRLAYPIEKHKEGHYVLFELRAEAAPIDEMVRRFKMSDSVLRFLTVRLDEEMRRQRKRQAELKERRGGDGSELEAERPPEGQEMAEREDVAEDEGEAEATERDQGGEP